MCSEALVRIVTDETDLINWRDPRRIRADFSTGAQALFRLKSNSFSLCIWAAQDLSCPLPECVSTQPAMAHHVFWTCISGRWHMGASTFQMTTFRSLAGGKTTRVAVWYRLSRSFKRRLGRYQSCLQPRWSSAQCKKFGITSIPGAPAFGCFDNATGHMDQAPLPYGRLYCYSRGTQCQGKTQFPPFANTLFRS